MEFIFIGVLGLVMGTLSSICGGSGVIGVPMMLALGFSPINTLALNVASDIGVISGAIKKYQDSKNIDWKLALIIMFPMVVGSFLGAKVITSLPENILKYVIVVGIFVGIFFLLKKPRVDSALKGERISIVGLFFIFLVGVWSGGLAMAGATFAVLVMVNFFHKTYLSARATDIVAFIPGTLISAIIITLNANVSPYLYLTIFSSSLIGALIGSHLAIKHGSEFVRKAMVAVAILMVIKVAVSWWY